MDTFEYRLLREVEFRESLFRRLPGEEATEKAAPMDKTQPPSAPQIMARPRNSKLLEGSEATFQAKITGNPKPKVNKSNKITFKNNIPSFTMFIYLRNWNFNITLMCPRFQITWFKNGQRIISSQRFQMSYTDDMAILHIHMALPEDAGYYTLLAENANGRIACSAHLVIEGVGVPVASTFQKQLQQQQKL